MKQSKIRKRSIENWKNTLVNLPPNLPMLTQTVREICYGGVPKPTHY